MFPRGVHTKKKDEVTKLLLSFPEKLQNCNDPDTVQAILTHMTQIDGLCNAVSMLPSGSSSRSSLPVDPTTVNEPVNDCQASVIAFNQKKRWKAIKAHFLKYPLVKSDNT